MSSSLEQPDGGESRKESRATGENLSASNKVLAQRRRHATASR